MYKTNAIEVTSENAEYRTCYRKRLYTGTRLRTFPGSSTRTYKGTISWFKISRDPLKFPSEGSCIQKYFPSFYCIGTREGTHIRSCTGSCTVLGSRRGTCKRYIHIYLYSFLIKSCTEQMQ